MQGSSLFAHIESIHAGSDWGTFLDAGTGVNSIKWVASLETERWTAVTGAPGHAIQVRDVMELIRRPQDRIVLGNWADPELLAGERYDTVLADYLLGAVEGFAPYFQGQLFKRLRPLVGRRLYVVGVEPYVTHDPGNLDGQLAWEIGRHRDASLILAGERPYREYPARWAISSLAQSGYRMMSSDRFAISYKARFVNSQIDMAALRLARLPDRNTASVLVDRGEELRERALTFVAEHGGIRHGHDYVLAAEPV